MKEYNYGFRYVAFDSANGEYQEFKTIKDAENWLTEGDGEAISEDACNGQNYIAEIQYKSAVTKLEDKSDYHEHTDDCPDDCEEEEWPYDDDWYWIGKQQFEKIDWG